MDIARAPTFDRDPRRVVGSYDPATVAPKDASSISSLTGDSLDEAVQWATTADEIDGLIDTVNDTIDEQTAGMYIPVDPSSDPAVADAVEFMSNGDHRDYIDQGDWRKSLSTDALLVPPELDLLDMLWAEIRIRIAEWLAQKVEDIPVIGDDLADALRSDAEEAVDESFMGELHRETPTLSTIPSLLPASVKSMIHSKSITEYIGKYISTPGPTTFNPMAVDVKPAVDAVAVKWGTARDIVSKTYAIPILPDVVVTGITPPGRTNMTEWVRSEGRELVAPAIDAYSYIRGRIITPDFWKYGVERSRGFLNGVQNTLGEYARGGDIACCLLSNILGLHGISPKSLNILRMLRLGLRYSFNGLSIDAGSIFDLMADILNRIISIAMGKVITTIQEAMDNKFLAARNFMADFSSRKGEAWRRCYPFDELMTYALEAIKDMEEDIIGYILDYTNMMKVSHTNLNKYMVVLKKREYARHMIGVMDMLIKGIETGMICKDLGSMDKEYTRPTPEELEAFITDYSTRMTTDVRTAREKYMRAPHSGTPLVPGMPLTGMDMKLIQNCDLSLTTAELEALEQGLAGVGVL